MKKTLLALVAIAIASPVFAQEAAKTEMTEEQKSMYFLGGALYSQVQSFEFTAEEQEYITKGFNDAVKHESVKLDAAKYNAEVQKVLEAKYKVKVDAVKKEGQAFIARETKANKKLKPQTLKSGVVFIQTKKGSGKSPKETDVVRVHYHGTFSDGKVFDSSVERKQPAEFPLNGVVPCWTEAVQKMKVGGKAILLCPSETAYGDRQVGPIPGGSTLKFEVELLDIVPPAPEETPAETPENK